jgi:hypothetical protein
MIVGMVDEMIQEAEGQRKESTSINKKSRGQQGLQCPLQNIYTKYLTLLQIMSAAAIH